MFGVRGEPRIIDVDEHAVNFPPGEHMLVVRNSDRPGMVGFVGTVLGKHGININDMQLGRSADGVPALIIFSTDVRVPPAVQAEIAAQEGILSVNTVG